MEYVRGNVDYLTITETKKKSSPRKNNNKKINVWSNYYKSNQSTIHLFIECKVTFSHK